MILALYIYKYNTYRIIYIRQFILFIADIKLCLTPV